MVRVHPGPPESQVEGGKAEDGRFNFSLNTFNLQPAVIGGVAQLGEHLPCTQGVIGSIPFTSTNLGEKVEG
jgi:hypothetical protein